MIQNQKRIEARQYLSTNANSSPFAGNRFSKQSAIEYVEDLYTMGAVTVYVTGIYDEPYRIEEYGGPYADTLIVVLPKDRDQRQRIFALNAEESEAEGFAPEEDIGQDELLFWWD